MVVSEKEPYEQNLQTKVKWNFSKKQLFTSFKRDKKTEDIIWIPKSKPFADRLILVDKKDFWKAEIQAMTNVRFHLHVESIQTKNLILFSGILVKANPLFQSIRFIL